MIKPLFAAVLLTAGTLLSGTSLADEVQEKPAFDPPPLQLEKLA